MIPVILESPYRAETLESAKRNAEYTDAAMRDCLSRDESPMASHVLWARSGILNDDNLMDRSLGIRAGQAWLKCVAKVVVYTDLGISEGMREGIRVARRAQVPIERRALKGWSDLPRELDGAAL